MATPAINLDEWTKELERLQSVANSEGRTTRELMESLGLCRQSVMNLLHKLQRAGRLRPVKKSVLLISGVKQLTTAYVILPEKRKR